MKKIIITNNPMVYEKLSSNHTVDYLEENLFIDVLIKARNLIHQNYKLLTHPLMSSIKPNETPYKSVIVTKRNELDLKSLSVIEESITTTKKFLNNEPLRSYSKSIHEDFQLIDYDLIYNAINS